MYNYILALSTLHVNILIIFQDLHTAQAIMLSEILSVRVHFSFHFILLYMNENEKY